VLKGHPNIIDLLATAQDEVHLYFIFEVSTNGNLFELCTKRGKLSLEVSRAYAAQIVTLLHYMQVRKISHRDMKPHNLMLDDNWNIKLIDFGDSKILDSEEDNP
jgi:serine/threonine protein kinase